ncbi:Thioredoxin domain-containing protein [Psidium guajava]|nr:Thioredoxin domain-containing protein [Psidium guajava]
MGDPSKIEGGSEKNNTVMTDVISSSSNRITDKKLEGGANFHQWKKIVKLTLTGRNQHRHLTEPKPSDDENWDVIDARILGQMLNSMESNIVDMVTYVDTVREL